VGHNTILTIGALVLLGGFMVSANGILSQNSVNTEQTEYVLTALSLAQSIVEEAKAKAFDERTKSAFVSVADSLSVVLGRDAGEAIASPDTLTSSGVCSSASIFDDVDDYNGYVRLVNTERGTGYRLVVGVKYVSETNPDSDSYVPTFCKKLTVSVTSPFFETPISINCAYTY
jgi:hypothetical protein